jgi:hypothetical protein
MNCCGFCIIPQSMTISHANEYVELILEEMKKVSLCQEGNHSTVDEVLTLAMRSKSSPM